MKDDHLPICETTPKSTFLVLTLELYNEHMKPSALRMYSLGYGVDGCRNDFGSPEQASFMNGKSC
jgi:hypothetical protein